MKIVLVTDAWHPQVNGVVRTLSEVVQRCEASGHEILVIHPGLFRTLPCPTYPEIRLAWFPGREVARRLEAFRPAALHIATEGPLGMAARRWALRRSKPFTTSLHTRFPDYLHTRFGLPMRWTWAWMRRFHSRATRVMVATASLREELLGAGFDNAVRWSRGVDTTLFHPGCAQELDLARPIFLSVGRLAPEKNIEGFLELDLPGTKLVVGDGPSRSALEARFPEAVFLGKRFGAELASIYAASDVFVFSSRTDTFGLVLLEALACGTPVAAYPVAGPLDVVGDAPVGVLDEDLARAARAALEIDRATCVDHAALFSWEECARRFVELLEIWDASDVETPRKAVTCPSPG